MDESVIISSLEQASRTVFNSHPLTACELAEIARYLKQRLTSDDANRRALSAHWHG